MRKSNLRKVLLLHNIIASLSYILLTLLPTISIIKIIKETGTAGSSPLQVIDENFDTWFAKSTTDAIPFTELINEVVCSELAKRWGFNQPTIGIAQFSEEVVNAYLKEIGSFSVRYKNIADNPFFCSCQLRPAFELEPSIGSGTLPVDWQSLVNRNELYKIGYFDYWVCNQDRRPGGPNNILLYDTPQGRRFVPFDHTAAFGQYANYRDIPNAGALTLSPERSILKHPLCKHLLRFGTPLNIELLQSEVRKGIEASLQDLNEIFEQVPAAWGFSKKAKAHLKELLSNTERNERIINLLPINV